MRHLPALLCLLFASTAWADATVPTRDIDGAKDPAWLKRYEGSFIVSHEHRGFDAVKFPASPLVRVPDQTDAYNNNVFRAMTQREVEGEYTRLVYIAPADRSPSTNAGAAQRPDADRTRVKPWRDTGCARR